VWDACYRVERHKGDIVVEADEAVYVCGVEGKAFGMLTRLQVGIDMENKLIGHPAFLA